MILQAMKILSFTSSLQARGGETDGIARHLWSGQKEFESSQVEKDGWKLGW